MPARPPPSRPSVRRSRSWGAPSSIRQPAPRLLHLDVHDAALGHTHLDLRYLLMAENDDPHPPPGESPDARWCSWDEAMAIADAGLVDALPLARAAYQANGGRA